MFRPISLDAPSAVNAAPAPPSTRGERLSASFTAEGIRTDAWQKTKRLENDILADAYEAAGEAVPSVYNRSPAGARARRAALFAYVSEQRQADPEKWGHIPASEEELRNLTTARLKAEYDDAQRVLRLAPEGAFAIETLGAIGRAATDEVGVTSLLLGAGIGSAARLGVLGRVGFETALGAGGEAASLPAQFRQSERLGIEPPDPATQILAGAVGAAALSAVGEGVAYGVRRFARDPENQAAAAAANTAGLPEPVHNAGEANAGRAMENDEPVPSYEDAQTRAALSPKVTNPQQFDALLDAQIWAESNYDPNAVSPVGAQGLAQIMPDTARDPGFGVAPVRNPFDPEEALRFQRDYMTAMMNRYEGDHRRALAAYNWGAGNADKWNGDLASLPAETRDYILKIEDRIGVADSGGFAFSPPRSFRKSDLQTDERAYQWKDSPTRISEPWDEQAAGLMVVHERLDGRRVIADGHARYAAAPDDARVNAIVLREADGWTEESVVARTAIMDFLETQDAAGPRRLEQIARERSARQANPVLFDRLTQAETDLTAAQRGFDPQRAVRLRERVDAASTNRQRQKARENLDRHNAEIDRINALRSEVANLTAQRNALLAEQQAPQTRSDVRPRDAIRAVQDQGDRPDAFQAAPERGVRATVKDVAAHVRSRVGSGAGGSPSPAPVAPRVSGPAVTPQLVADLKPGSAALSEAADAALYDLRAALGKAYEVEGDAPNPIKPELDYEVIMDMGDGPVRVKASAVLADLEAERELQDVLEACRI